MGSQLRATIMYSDFFVYLDSINWSRCSEYFKCPSFTQSTNSSSFLGSTRNTLSSWSLDWSHWCWYTLLGAYGSLSVLWKTIIIGSYSLVSINLVSLISTSHRFITCWLSYQQWGMETSTQKTISSTSSQYCLCSLEWHFLHMSWELWPSLSRNYRIS